MNALASECSSGCESGWTLYFEQSMDTSPPLLDEKRSALFGFEADSKRAAGGGEEDDEEEEEDLSMVSDASSGPPHLHEEDEEEDGRRFREGSGWYGKTECLRVPETECRSSRKKRTMGDHLASSLDDTASSPLVNLFPSDEFVHRNNGAAAMDSVLKCSHGFLTTDFERSSAFHDQFGIPISFSSHQIHKNQWPGSRKKMQLR